MPPNPATPAHASIDPAATDDSGSSNRSDVGLDAADGVRERRSSQPASNHAQAPGPRDEWSSDEWSSDEWSGDEWSGGHGSPDDESSEAESRWREARWAVAGGLVAAGSVVVIAVLIGQVSAFEARRLFEGIKPTATFAASTYIGAGTTVLALMATMIGFSISHQSRFRASHYRRLRIVAVATTALIVVAIAMLSCLIVPIAEADAPTSGYIVLYWAIVGLGAVGAGLTVAIVLMLNYTVRGLIDLGRLGRSHLTHPSDDGR